MMTFLHAVSYGAAIVGFVFVTLSLASGLLYIAEVIEEHTKLAKKVGRRSIYAIILLHVAFYVLDKFPLWKILFSIGCHLVYLRNFSGAWPAINLTSPTFVASCVLVLVDHFVWFRHFSALAATARMPLRPGGPYSRPTHASYNNPKAYHQGVAFMDVASFFAICVWFIPLYLFLSLSANDNALPSFGSNVAPPANASHKNQPLIYTLFHSIASLLPRSILPRRLRNTFRATGTDKDGLLAPSSSAPPSPAGGSVYGGYEPWGSSGGGTTTPGVYTPGASALGSPAAGFRSALPPTSSTGTLHTPPPPMRRESSFASASNVDGGSPRAPSFSLGVAGGAPPPMKRKPSALGLSSTVPGGKGGKDD